MTTAIILLKVTIDGQWTFEPGEIVRGTVTNPDSLACDIRLEGPAPPCIRIPKMQYGGKWLQVWREVTPLELLAMQAEE